jgi:hypothetical protein
MFLPPSPHYPVCGPTLRGSLESERPKGQRGVYHRILLGDGEQKRGMSPFCCRNKGPSVFSERLKCWVYKPLRWRRIRSRLPSAVAHQQLVVMAHEAVGMPLGIEAPLGGRKEC